MVSWAEGGDGFTLLLKNNINQKQKQACIVYYHHTIQFKDKTKITMIQPFQQQHQRWE